MNKLLVLVLILCIAFSVTGCGGDEGDANQPTPTPTPTQFVPAVQAPTPTQTAFVQAAPTPFPWVEVEDYVMIWKNDTDRGISYKIPVHWRLEQSGPRHLVYYEPTPENENGFRIFLANKKESTEPNASAMRTNLSDILANMESEYADFKSDGKVSKDIKLVRFSGYSTYYTYTDEYGMAMKGFVIIATYNRRIYCMNYSGPEARFAEMQSIGVSILDSITRVT